MNFQQWFAAHKRRNPKAKINERTRDLYRAWLRRNPRDPGEGGPGAGRVPGLTPEVGRPSAPAPVAAPAPAAPAPPAPPPPPAAARQDAALERQILDLVDDRNNLSSKYNQQRDTASQGFRTGLLDAGFFDFVNRTSEETKTDDKGQPLYRPMEFREVAGTPQQNVRRLVAVDNPSPDSIPTGNVTYKFQYGPDGRVYRQAYMSNANTFAARGVSGSLVSDAQRSSRRAIDTARDQSIRNYNDTVDTIGRNQGTEDDNLTRAINSSNTAYQGWSGTQDVTLPTASAAAAPADASGVNNVVAPSVPTPSPTGDNGNLGSWTVGAAGRNATSRLNKLVKARNPGVSFRIVKRGNRYVAVRT